MVFGVLSIGLWYLVFGVWFWGCGVLEVWGWGLGLRVWGVRFGFWGLGFEVWGMGCGGVGVIANCTIADTISIQIYCGRTVTVKGLRDKWSRPRSTLIRYVPADVWPKMTRNDDA